MDSSDGGGIAPPLEKGSKKHDRDHDCSCSLDHIAEALRITVLYQDESIVVISKPGHLRSVPGHARNDEFAASQPTGPRKRPRDENDTSLTGQRAWIAAIYSFAKAEAAPENSGLVERCLIRLAGNQALSASAPRKYKVFCRYINRNRHRLIEAAESSAYSDKLANDMFQQIQEKYQTFLPEPTKPKDSALGQLGLLGLARTDGDQTTERLEQRDELYIVHRLDCETSGVMVFARTQVAASTLARNWRERATVSKSYMAHVQHWPPFHSDDERSGSIDLPLKPSDERIKWQTCSENDRGARPSQTRWRVLHESMGKGSLILDLTPVTGRTHQLRIHCAAVGSGITGDTLYTGVSDASRDNVTVDFTKVLHLHAYKLSFPHPDTGLKVEFTAEPPSWYHRFRGLHDTRSQAK